MRASCQPLRCLVLLAALLALPAAVAFVPGPAGALSAQSIRFQPTEGADEVSLGSAAVFGPPSRSGVVTMAVPKKRTSKMKTRSRRANWMRKSDKQAQRALSLAKSVLSGKQTSFIYNTEQAAADDAEQPSN